MDRLLLLRLHELFQFFWRCVEISLDFREIRFSLANFGQVPQNPQIEVPLDQKCREFVIKLRHRIPLLRNLVRELHAFVLQTVDNVLEPFSFFFWVKLLVFLLTTRFSRRHLLGFERWQIRKLWGNTGVADGVKPSLVRCSIKKSAGRGSNKVWWSKRNLFKRIFQIKYLWLELAILLRFYSCNGAKYEWIKIKRDFVTVFNGGVN